MSLGSDLKVFQITSSPMNEEDLLDSQIGYVSIITAKAIATCTQKGKKYHVWVALYRVIVSDMYL